MTSRKPDRLWIAVLLATIGLASVLAAEENPALGAPEGADLQEVVKLLAKTRQAAVVADASSLEVKLPSTISGLDDDQALARISVIFDRSVLRRPRGLALQRRFSDPSEDPGVEIEELRQAVSEGYRLIRPFAPRLSGVAFLRAQDDFTTGLSPAQQERMMGVGLPFSELPEQQQALWLDINRAQAYGDAVRELRRADLCFSGWQQVTVRDLAPMRIRHGDLGILFPDPRAPGGQDSISTQVPFARFQRRPSTPELMSLPSARTIRGQGMSAPCDLAAQQLTLRDLASLLRQHDGLRLEYPRFAADRKLCIAAEGTTYGDLLRSVADLWGWELSSTRSGVRIGRTGFAPARDVSELTARLTSCTPPPIRQLALAAANGTPAWRGEQLTKLVTTANRRLGEEWREVATSTLSQDDQRRLANVAAEQTLGWALLALTRKPRPWAISPERGYFTLSGPITADRHPTLMFWFRENERVKHGWGWGVGTAVYPK